jgi:hypothetical protein
MPHESLVDMRGPDILSHRVTDLAEIVDEDRGRPYGINSAVRKGSL